MKYRGIDGAYKKGLLSLSSTSTTAAAVLFVASCMMITIMILLGGINLLFASSLQMLGMTDKNMNAPYKTSINNTCQYTNANNTEDWKDPENNVKIRFTYLPEYPLPGNITTLIFHGLNLQTGSYLKNLLSGIT